MKKIVLFVFVFIVKVLSAQQLAPAYSLITHDPYFSIWSMTDTLNTAPTKHWTGADQALTGAVKIDGKKIYRILGNETKTYESILPTSDELDRNIQPCSIKRLV